MEYNNLTKQELINKIYELGKKIVDEETIIDRLYKELNQYKNIINNIIYIIYEIHSTIDDINNSINELQKII